MPLEMEIWLFDIRAAISKIETFLENQDFELYTEDDLRISAVERQLGIIGEAVTQVLKLEPEAAITDARKIIAFRNILIHNYARSVKQEFGLSCNRIYQF